MTALASSLASFLREHLPRERNASPHTVASYAHAFSLLLRYAAERLDRRPTDLTIEDLDPDLILGFLSYVEQDRGNTQRKIEAYLAGALGGGFGVKLLAMLVPALAGGGLDIGAIIGQLAGGGIGGAER